MKKYIIFLSLFSFCFSLVTLRAQDTIVLRNGKKMGIKVISVTNEVTYKLSSDTTKRHYYNLYKVSHIKYKDGSIYTINPMDTGSAKWKLCIILSAGLCSPLPIPGHTNNLFNSDNNTYVNSNFVGSGYLVSVTTELDNSKGFEFTVKGTYMSNVFDANGFINESILNNPFANYQNATSTGNYRYSDYAIMGGFTKYSSTASKVSGGYSLLCGALVTNTPDFEGVATGLPYPYSSHTQSQQITSNFNWDSETQTSVLLELDLFLKLRPIAHFFIKPEIGLMFTYMSNDGEYELITPGYYHDPSGSFFLGIASINLGLGYEL